MYPLATEVCGNAIDDNCNGSENEVNALQCTEYYRDSDRDNFGDPNISECKCNAGLTYTDQQLQQSETEFDTLDNTDCFDANALVNSNQQAYFDVDRGDGSFNYDCSFDGSGNPTIQQEYLSEGSCDGWLSNVGDCTMNTPGWFDDTIPGCGVSHRYIENNDDCSGVGCFTAWNTTVCLDCDDGDSAGFRTQRCR